MTRCEGGCSVRAGKPVKIRTADAFFVDWPLEVEARRATLWARPGRSQVRWYRLKSPLEPLGRARETRYRGVCVSRVAPAAIQHHRPGRWTPRMLSRRLTPMNSSAWNRIDCGKLRPSAWAFFEVDHQFKGYRLSTDGALWRWLGIHRLGQGRRPVDELVVAEAAPSIEHPDALDYVLRGRAAFRKPPSHRDRQRYSCETADANKPSR